MTAQLRLDIRLQKNKMYKNQLITNSYNLFNNVIATLLLEYSFEI